MLASRTMAAAISQVTVVRFPADTNSRSSVPDGWPLRSQGREPLLAGTNPIAAPEGRKDETTLATRDKITSRVLAFAAWQLLIVAVGFNPRRAIARVRTSRVATIDWDRTCSAVQPSLRD